MSNQSQLDQLKQFSVVVADTSDFSALKEFEPRDATTNPSLILKAAGMKEHQDLVKRIVNDIRKGSLSGRAQMDAILDGLLVGFGVEILKVVPGRVSTETDARIAFDTQALIAKARQLIALYEKQKIARERVLIKVASTWEGIRAAELLQKEGINCNLTLLFSLVQAAACAEAKVKLISPFVGRILDWYKKSTGKDYSPAVDPGVLSVHEIYSYYKTFGYSTEVMGASFRSKGEILELAGCDLLTISTQLLAELKGSSDPVPRKLDPAKAKKPNTKQLAVDEKNFRWQLNEDAMASDKLSEGIRLFAADTVKLEQAITAMP